MITADKWHEPEEVCGWDVVRPEGFEPPTPLVRSQMLYPAELRAHGVMCR